MVELNRQNIIRADYILLYHLIVTIADAIVLDCLPTLVLQYACTWPMPPCKKWGSTVALFKFVDRFCLKVIFLHTKVLFAQRKAVKTKVVLLKFWQLLEFCYWQVWNFLHTWKYGSYSPGKFQIRFINCLDSLGSAHWCFSTCYC